MEERCSLTRADPLITVLLPVRDYSPLLCDAVNSILNQSHTDLELLLVGYPTSDQWRHRLPRDARIRLLVRREPGIVSALNTGIQAAQGDFIARMDADDIALKDRLSTQLDYFNSHRAVDLVGARVEIFTAAGSLHQGNQYYQNWLNALTDTPSIVRNLLVESPLPHPTFFAPTALFRRLGYRECDWAEDYDFLLRAHLTGVQMGKPAEILVRWRDHANRLTRTSDRYSRQQFLRAKAWALTQLYPRQSFIICGTGKNAVRLYDALSERGATVSAFVEHDDARPRTSRRHRPVMTYSQILGNPVNELLVSAVSARGAGQAIRTLFTQHGLREGQQFVIAG